jgi:hypothetical protein
MWTAWRGAGGRYLAMVPLIFGSGCAAATVEFLPVGPATLGAKTCPIRRAAAPSEIELPFRIRVSENISTPVISAELEASDVGASWLKVFPDARLFTPPALTVNPPFDKAVSFSTNWLSARTLRLGVRATNAHGALFLDKHLECTVDPSAVRTP